MGEVSTYLIEFASGCLGGSIKLASNRCPLGEP